ncbi:acyltransferase family protein [Pseudomonas sp. Marseille-QA0892]
MTRLLHLDVARGLGILLVVIGHNWIVFNPKGELFDLIYSFHLPLFFFLSGIFFRPQQTLTGLARSKSDALLKPYLVTLMAFGAAIAITKPFDPIEYLSQITFATGGSLWSLYGEQSGITAYWAPLWFLPHLFVLSLAAWCWLRLSERVPMASKLSHVLLAALFAFGIWALPLQPTTAGHGAPGLPLSVDLVPVTLGFFLVGYYMREAVQNFQGSRRVLLLSIAVFVGGHALGDHSMDLNKRFYGNALETTAIAFAGIYLSLALSHRLAQRPGIATRVLAFLGEASLLILIFHSLFQSKSHHVMVTHLSIEPALAAPASFAIGLLAPLVIHLAVQRIRPLGWLYLPLRGKRKGTVGAAVRG